MITMLSRQIRYVCHSEQVYDILWNGAKFSTASYNGRAWVLELPWPATDGKVGTLQCYCKDDHAIRREIAKANAEYDSLDEEVPAGWGSVGTDHD